MLLGTFCRRSRYFPYVFPSFCLSFSWFLVISVSPLRVTVRLPAQRKSLVQHPVPSAFCCADAPALGSLARPLFCWAGPRVDERPSSARMNPRLHTRTAPARACLAEACSCLLPRSRERKGPKFACTRGPRACARLASARQTRASLRACA